MIGKTLAHYEILEKLGQGGMGEVYLARDTKLGRDVALKLLPSEFADDADRLARLRREAQLLASLNHPQIAAIYGFEEVGEQRFLVMELAEGEDLAVRLERGPLSVADAIEVAHQLTEALSAAHEKGIVHRDLKPANIKLGAGGEIKVLDFGLAKAYTGEPESPVSGMFDSPTLTQHMTMAGVIIGTAAYMSPEQARGAGLDKRADIWAFGVILFEMLTGRQLFEGPTVSDMLASVLKSDPDWDQLPAETPTPVRRLLRRCLAKDPRQRLHDIADAGLDLQEKDVAEPSPAGVVAPAVPTRSTGRYWALIAIVALAGGLGWWRSFDAAVAPNEEVRRLSISMPPGVALADAEECLVAISPDGQRIAYVALEDGARQLFIRPVDRFDAIRLPSTNGAAAPFFSPDGRWVAFFAGGELKKVSVEGGDPITICSAGRNRGGSWAKDDRIVFSPLYASGLLTVPAAGGTPVALTVPDTTRGERTHRWPQVAPDGRWVVFTIGTLDSPNDYDDAEIAIASLEDGSVHRLPLRASAAQYTTTGYLILARGGDLLATRFDPANPQDVQGPVPIVRGVEMDFTSGAAHYAVASSGEHITYVPQLTVNASRTLVWADRTGQIEPVPVAAGRYSYPRVSPDGTKFAVMMGTGRGNDENIWIYDLERQSFSRLSFEARAVGCAWSPDSRRIAYAALGAGRDGIVTRNADGSDEGQLLRSIMVTVDIPSDWHHVQDAILCDRLGGVDLADITLIPLEPNSTPEMILNTPYDEGGVRLSPDGNWMAYISDETGTYQVYVRGFGGRQGKWQVSSGQGTDVMWSPTGTELFYLDETNQMMAVEVKTDPVFQAGPPKPLFSSAQMTASLSLEATWDVAPDGQRFLMILGGSTEGGHELRVMQGLNAELKQVLDQP